MIEVSIASQHASLKIRLVEIGPDKSVRLSVRAKGYGYSGRNKNVWIMRSDLATFLAELRALEASRSGVAKTESASPREFVLALKSTSPIGAVRADFSISSFVTGRVPEAPTLSMGFAFDSSLLPEIVKRFEAIAARADSFENLR